MIRFLAANPVGTDRRSLDREARSIHAELKRSGYRDRFQFETRWAVEPLDLLRELRELKPTVVHFSGHGGAQTSGARGSQRSRHVVAAPDLGVVHHTLCFHDAAAGAQVVSPDALARTLGAAGASVKLVVLNACFTEPIAEALVAHVDCVVGMSGAIHDDAARSFAIGFYGGLGEHESVAAAFEHGHAAIRLDGRAEMPSCGNEQILGFRCAGGLLRSAEMSRMFTATVKGGVIADQQLASLPDGATVTVLIVESDPGALDERTEQELEERIAEADRGDSFVDASEVLRRMDARRTKS